MVVVSLRIDVHTCAPRTILLTSYIVFSRFSLCLGRAATARVIFSSRRYHLQSIKAVVNDAPVKVRTVERYVSEETFLRAHSRALLRVLEAIDEDFNNRLHYV